MFFRFYQSFADKQHEFLVESLLILEVFHELEIPCEEVLVERQVIEVCLEQFLGIVEVFVVLDNEFGILHKDVAHHIHIVLEDCQHSVVNTLSIVPLLLPNL